MTDIGNTVPASGNSVKPATWRRGLTPADATDRKVFVGLVAGCLTILFLFFMDWYTYVPEPTYGQPAPQQASEYFQFSLLIIPLYVSLFLAIFMKTWTARILSVLFLGIPFALLFPALSVDESLPDEVVGLFALPFAIYLLTFLVSLVYLVNFGVRRIRGRDTRPSMKSVSLQTVLTLLLLFILFVYS